MTRINASPSTVRPPAVAGMFYPLSADQLAADIDSYLADVQPRADTVPPKAIIAPHAGYVYSGPIAAHAYALLKPVHDMIRRVVVLGPCHRVAVRGLAAPSQDAFQTPLGNVPVDRDAIETISALPQVSIFDATHAQEHSLEVHLPFLQSVLDDFTVVPLVVGDASDDEVAEVLGALWGGPETLIVVSSDLTHYLDYDTARSMDAKTSTAIEHLNPGGIGEDQACGRVPVRGLLTLAKQKGLKAATLDVRNSGDTAGDKSRVVGYGAWAFFEGGTDTNDSDDFESQTHDLLATYGDVMLRLAAASIDNGLKAGSPAHANVETFPPELQAKGACFVTLKKNGQLRGCIGSPEAYRPLIEDVAENAFAAGFRDPRFSPLTREELGAVTLSVSVLSPSTPMTIASEADLLAQLRPGIDGLIIEDQGRRALFLPSVWESLPEAKAFLAHLKAKAGLPADHFSPAFKAWRFIAVELSSDDLSAPLWAE